MNVATHRENVRRLFVHRHLWLFLALEWKRFLKLLNLLQERFFHAEIMAFLVGK